MERYLVWNERTVRLLGESGYSLLHHSKVLVIGCGGVGGSAIEMLARAGVGSLYLVDADQFEISNINRQLFSTHQTIGKNKIDVAAQRALNINPHCHVESRKIFIDANNITDLFDKHQFDFVVDAIDTLQPKVELLAYFHKRKIPVVSSMGAGGKFDPHKIEIKDISKTYNCMLAKNVRRRLAVYQIRKGITCVFSPETIDKSKVEETNGDGFKKSIIGTISYMPNLFGIYCSYEVIQKLLQK